MKYHSIEEAAEILGISTVSVLSYVYKGVLDQVIEDDKRFITDESIRRRNRRRNDNDQLTSKELIGIKKLKNKHAVKTKNNVYTAYKQNIEKLKLNSNIKIKKQLNKGKEKRQEELTGHLIYKDEKLFTIKTKNYNESFLIADIVTGEVILQ